jgi:Xaa-Pro aminopeptidase
VDPEVVAERSVKRERLLGLLPDGAPGLLLTSAASTSWYLAGARVDVGAGGAPVLAVVAGLEEDTVFCLENEVERLCAEELPSDVEVVPVPWFADPAAAARAAFGPALGAEEPLTVGLRAARAHLLPPELGRYRSLGRDAATALGEALQQARPDTTERELAAAVAGRVVATGADVTVLLVAGASRLHLRHPVVGTGRLGDRAMVVVCARRHGLIANLTRWVRFRAATADETRSSAAVLQVEADTFAATRPARHLTAVLQDIRAAYVRHGFSEQEWSRHHQGGPTGYAGRDPRVTPSVPDVVAAGGAFAWNPTAPGVKVEDTVVIGPGGIEVLTRDDDWPTVEVRGLRRPAELDLG